MTEPKGGPSLVAALRALVEACENAFGMDDFADDEDVTSPPSGITFGMIRASRAELEALSCAGERVPT